jgi:3-oxoacyl-[acyl-carrier-protein] synthase II
VSAPHPSVSIDDRVVVTGLGMISPLGEGVAPTWAALCRGEGGIRRFDRFGDRLPSCLAATLPAPWSAASLWSWDGSDDEPLCAIALAAASEAWRHAQLDRSPVDPARVAIILGTSGGGMISRSRYELGTCDAARRHRLLERSRPDHCTATVAESLGIRGPRLTISTTCTSSANAIAHACELLAAGAADVVLAGGAEVVAAEAVAGFLALGALAPGPCAPFSEPVGLTLGEGAGLVVLERRSAARARGVEPLCAVLGYGLSADGHHATAPEPNGEGMARAIHGALADAGLAPAQIGYFNAHGTGTLANDRAECRAIERVFGPATAHPPVSSSKGHLGHARGAAGVLELTITALALRDQVVPPTLHFRAPRPGASPRDPIPGALPRPHTFRYAVTHNAGFGGTNAAIVLGPASDADADAHERARADRPTAPVDLAILGHHTLRAVDGARLADGLLTEALRGVDTRGMDHASRCLVAATALALRSAGLPPHAAARERAGVIVAASAPPWESADELWGSLRARGFERASAPAFSRFFANAPAGSVTRALGLRGPMSVVSGGVGSSLRALVLASWMLRHRRDADLYVVGSAFEVARPVVEDHAFRQSTASAGVIVPPPRESASVVVLANAECPESRGARAVARLTGCAMGGPGELASTVRRALGEARELPGELDLLVEVTPGDSSLRAGASSALREALGERHESVRRPEWASALGGSDGDDAVALGLALEELTAGRATRVLLVASEARAGNTAIVVDARASASPTG